VIICPYTYFALNHIPDFLLMIHYFLIMLRFQYVQIVDLALEDRKSFTEGLEV